MNDDLHCRICFDDTEPLISPCACTGSMRWVHADCLNAWRARSLNPQSFHRCDQCHTPYALIRHRMTPYIESTRAQTVVSILIFSTLVITSSLALAQWPVTRVFCEFVGFERTALSPALDALLGGLIGIGVIGIMCAMRERVRRDDSFSWLIGIVAATQDVRTLRALVALGAWHSAHCVRTLVERVAARCLVQCSIVLDRA